MKCQLNWRTIFFFEFIYIFFFTYSFTLYMYIKYFLFIDEVIGYINILTGSSSTITFYITCLRTGSTPIFWRFIFIKYWGYVASAKFHKLRKHPNSNMPLKEKRSRVIKFKENFIKKIARFKINIRQYDNALAIRQDCR